MPFGNRSANPSLLSFRPRPKRIDYTIYTVAATGIARSLTERRARSLRRATAGVYLLAAGALATR